MGGVIQNSWALRELSVLHQSFSAERSVFYLLLNAVRCGCNIQHLCPSVTAAHCCIRGWIFLLAVMVIGRQAWLHLVPQLCFAPVTWDHLVRSSLSHPWLTLLSLSVPRSDCTTLLFRTKLMSGSCPTPTVGNNFPFSTDVMVKKRVVPTVLVLNR